MPLSQVIPVLCGGCSLKWNLSASHAGVGEGDRGMREDREERDAYRRGGGDCKWVGVVSLIGVWFGVPVDTGGWVWLSEDGDLGGLEDTEWVWSGRIGVWLSEDGEGERGAWRRLSGCGLVG